MAEIIQSLPLEDVIGDRFGRYSKYIIQERALPDVRDGLKPVQRRILYAMYSSGNTYDKNFRKVRKPSGMLLVNSTHMAIRRFTMQWCVSVKIGNYVMY